MSNRKQALYVIRRLRQRGFDGLLAGGCVRDRLLKRPASDYDVVTNAVPDQIIDLFHRTLKIGVQFGVVMVLIKGKQVEVATFRTEGGYSDGRRPDYVEFASAREDASRRDFTVNGMFYDPIKKKLYDFVGGQEDLRAQVLRTIGEPEQRFSEDYLRMLRAVRFAVKLDFTIEPNTWRSIGTHAQKITRISAERIALELEEILTHPNRCRGAELLLTSGLAGALFPDVDENSLKEAIHVFVHMPKAVDFALAMSAFFAGLDTAKAVGLCEALKLSNATLKHIRFLLEYRGIICDAPLSLSRLKLLMHEPYFDNLCVLQRALLKSQGQSLRPLTLLKKRAAVIDPTAIHPKPLLDGHMLIALGATPGPMVGRLARELYIAQLEDRLQTAEQARQWATDWLALH